MSDFKAKLKEIASLREMKGKEQETISMIKELLPQAEEAGDWKTVATLYWELHLVWQHCVMKEFSKPEGDRDIQDINDGIQSMIEYAERAKEVIEEHGLEDMAGGAYRFLGRGATYAGKHEKAKEYYETAISRYSGKNERSKLEVRGFLSETLVRLGEVEQGLDLAKKTYEDFFKSDLGKKLKEDDYFVWAVWMSGIPPRMVKALQDEGVDFDKKEMKEWLLEVKKELKDPSGEVTWGDDKFQFRMDEIEAALTSLE